MHHSPIATSSHLVVDGRVPVGVHNDHSVRGRQREAKPTDLRQGSGDGEGGHRM